MLAAALQFDSVAKEYRSGFLGRERVTALDAFSLGVEAGEIFGFLGPNGSGKSTAIHIAMGFVRATRGGGSVLGHPFGDAGTHRRIGFLAENVTFYHLPALRAVRFYGALNGVRDPQLRERTHEVLNELDLTEFSQRNISKFSRGMLQRLGLAQALVNDPELLILDEPTSALDPLSRVRVRELLLRCKAAGKTVFLSSHQLSEVELICDRVAFLNAGRLMQIGRTQELLAAGDRVEFQIVSGDLDMLRTRLLPLAPVWWGGNGAAAGAAHEARLQVARSDAQVVAEHLWSSGAQVVSMNPVRKSLEELFLEMTESGARADRPQTGKVGG